VLQPISLRPDPAAPDEYIINYGERRYRAPTLSGLAEIPAWVHTKLTGYDQVIENLHRADRSPMEVALFIQERLAAGDKKGKIARRLGKKGSFVTEHQALVEAVGGRPAHPTGTWASEPKKKRRFRRRFFHCHRPLTSAVPTCPGPASVPRPRRKSGTSRSRTSRSSAPCRPA
jgi:hypothetical protein